MNFTRLAIIASSVALSDSVLAADHSDETRQSSPAWTLAQSFGGNGSDRGETVKVDREGNRYVTGEFSGTAYFPQQAAQPASGRKALTATGGQDIFLAKYDALGKLKWLTQAGGPGDDGGYDLAFDGAGNVYMTGELFDSATFRGVTGASRSVIGLARTIFLAKYTSSGGVAWVQTGTAAFDSINQGFGVAVEPITGSVYLTGMGQAQTQFSSSNGATHSVDGPWTWHMVLVKYDTAGNFQWGQTNEAAPNSIAHKVAVDADNNAYVTGWMEGFATFHSNDGNDLTVYGFSEPVQTYPDYPGDAFIVKYDEKGNVQWVNHIGGYKAIGTDIATSRDGKVSVVGFIGNVAGSPQQAATIVSSELGGNSINLGGGRLTSPYNKDAFVATYDEDGVLLSARRLGGVKNDGASGVAYDRRGNLIVAGTFQGMMRIEGRTLTGKDTSNLFVAKFSREDPRCTAGSSADPDQWPAFPANSLVWLSGATGALDSNFENGPRAGLSARGDVLVAGALESATQFGGFKLQSAGMQDGFLAMLKAPRSEEGRPHRQAAEQ